MSDLVLTRHQKHTLEMVFDLAIDRLLHLRQGMNADGQSEIASLVKDIVTLRDMLLPGVRYPTVEERVSGGPTGGGRYVTRQT